MQWITVAGKGMKFYKSHPHTVSFFCAEIQNKHAGDFRISRIPNRDVKVYYS